MRFDMNNSLDSFKDGIKETAELAHDKTSEFHENYVSKVIPDCGKYGDAAKFAAEMLPGVAEYNAIKDGDWQKFAITAGIDVTALAIGAVTAGAGFAAVKGGTSVAKAGVKVATREIAEAGVEKVTREAIEAGAEKLVKETTEAGIEKIAKETVEAGAEKTAKEMAEAGTKKTVKETVEGVSKESVEKIASGGSYRDVRKACEGTTNEVHHTPAKSASFLDELDGPAIKMDKFDHQQTASWGNSVEAREYRKMQQELIDNGKFRKALEMDIEDIRSKFADKYDDAIHEMLEYVNKLELEGKLYNEIFI